MRKYLNDFKIFCASRLQKWFRLTRFRTAMTKFIENYKKNNIGKMQSLFVKYTLLELEVIRGLFDSKNNLVNCIRIQSFVRQIIAKNIRKEL